MDKPDKYYWIYIQVDGQELPIALAQGSRDIMVATGDGQSSWLDFAPSAKTMIENAVNGRASLIAENGALKTVIGEIAMIIHSHPAGDLQGWGEIQTALVEYQNSDAAMRAARAEGK